MILVGILFFNNAVDKKEIKILSKTFNKLYLTTPMQHHTNKISILYAKNNFQKTLTTNNTLFIGRAIHSSNFSQINLKQIQEFEQTSTNLMTQYWGGYIIATRTPHGFKLLIDPSGQTELYYAKLPSGNIIFSTEIALIKSVFDNDKLALNYQYLANILLYADYGPIDSLYTQIKRLPSGCEVEISPSKITTQTLWDPNKFIKSGLYQQIDFADLLQAVLKAWCEPYENIYLSFSGGLDSSAILYSLLNNQTIKPNQKFVAINYYAKNLRSSDEYQHVKKICHELKFDLQRHDLNNFSFFEKPQTFAYKLNNPITGLAFWNHLPNIYEISGIKQTSLFINGYGGDHVFMQSPPISSIVDAFFYKGLKCGYNASKNLCHINRSTIFNILVKNLSGITGKLSLNNTYFIDKAKWITTDCLQYTKNFIPHPALAKINTFPGKQEHIDSIYRGLGTLEPTFAKNYERVFNPFLSQPIIEWALSVPSFELYDNNIDRFLVRKSIGEAFNTQTIWRTDKGSTTGQYLAGIRNNLEFILDTCLNGFYAKNNLIEQAGVRDNILRLSKGDSDCFWPFLRLYCAELFLQANTD